MTWTSRPEALLQMIAVEHERDESDHQVASPGAQSPAPFAADVILSDRIDRLARSVRRVRKSENPSARAIHRMRVASRRADAALRAIGDSLDPSIREQAARRVNRVRKAAASLRSADVHRALLEALPHHESSERARRHLIRRIRRGREADQKAMRRGLKGLGPRRFRRLSREMLEALGDGACANTLEQIARGRLSRKARAMLLVDPTSLQRASDLHALRISGKHLRYMLETVEPVLESDVAARTKQWLVRLQDRLGQVNDLDSLFRLVRRRRKRVSRRSGKSELARSCRSLEGELRTRRDWQVAEFREWWGEDGRRILESIERDLGERSAKSERLPGQSSIGEDLEVNNRVFTDGEL